MIVKIAMDEVLQYHPLNSHIQVFHELYSICTVTEKFRNGRKVMNKSYVTYCNFNEHDDVHTVCVVSYRYRVCSDE